MKRKLLEKDIEKYLVEQVEAAGGMAEKFTSPNRRSVPDRLCLFPGGGVFFVECKAPGKKPTSAQLRDHKRRRELGFTVSVVDSKDGVDLFIENCEDECIQ